MVQAPSSPQAADLAKRLGAAGAKMYGAFWCSHCQEQKAAFGAAAQRDLPYVECYPQGYHKVWLPAGYVSCVMYEAALLSTGMGHHGHVVRQAGSGVVRCLAFCGDAARPSGPELQQKVQTLRSPQLLCREQRSSLPVQQLGCKDSPPGSSTASSIQGSRPLSSWRLHWPSDVQRIAVQWLKQDEPLLNVLCSAARCLQLLTVQGA